MFYLVCAAEIYDTRSPGIFQGEEFCSVDRRVLTGSNPRSLSAGDNMHISSYVLILRLSRTLTEA